MSTNTVVGLFDYYSDADTAVKALQDYGLDEDHISVVAREKDTIKHRTDDPSGAKTGAATGAAAGGLVGLLAGLSALVIPGVGPVIATGAIASVLATTLGLTAVGAGIGAATGGLLGGLVDLGFSHEEAEFYAEGVKRGGVLVSVETGEEDENEIADILRRAGAVDMGTRRQTWKNDGWTSYDDEDIEETREVEKSDEDAY